MLISPAFAQEAAGTAATVAATGDVSTAAGMQAPGFLTSMAPLVIIFAIFYLLVLRPQNKRMVEHRAMLNKLEKGDRVVTGGGLVGTVVKLVGEEEILIDLGQGHQVTALRNTLMMRKTDGAAKGK